MIVAVIIYFFTSVGCAGDQKSVEGQKQQEKGYYE